VPAPIATTDKSVYRPGETVKITATSTPRVTIGLMTDQDGRTTNVTIIVSAVTLSGFTATPGPDTGDATTRTTVFTGTV